MSNQLALGYLRSGFTSDAELWQRHSNNAHEIYKANQAVLARKSDEAARHFDVSFEPSDPTLRLFYWCGRARLHALTGNVEAEDSHEGGPHVCP